MSGSVEHRPAQPFRQVPSNESSELCLTPEEAAELLHVSPRTLSGWRITGKGPVFSHVGHKVVYTRRRLIEFIQQNEKTSTSQTA